MTKDELIPNVCPLDVEVVFSIDKSVLFSNILFISDANDELLLKKAGPEMEMIHIPKFNILYYAARMLNKEES